MKAVIYLNFLTGIRICGLKISDQFLDSWRNLIIFLILFSTCWWSTFSFQD